MGARLLMTCLALCLLPATGFAQLIGTMPGLRSASLPDTTLTSSINQDDLFRARPDTYAPTYDRLLPRHRQSFGGGYVSDFFVPSDSRKGQRSSYRRAARVQPNGHLRLLVEPASTEVHLDGFFLGSVDDFRRSGGSIPAGPHRVELRAPGQDPVIFNVNILPYDIVTYRNDLGDAAQPGERPAAATNVAPAPAVARAPAKTFYVIPGCYAGDKRPSRDRLAPGCDISKLRTIPPVVSVIAGR